ncbi:thiol:disulfide interchange protein DsbA/DsbL [Inhella gelatinilytica]|uniref:Thiol:disulfide interchange protein n=1 Tax=Inhella gelatinilytica TaxID=2795030 RepID=A0A931NCU1_9BURK|nr:thiol:disulfide interchange protein DsbA/DsbL [Inhella gelatinilytica]MBH9551585.1 thiol:disulfide interchange protein DsbA/DsbL [Inhella gelatinilytica]
MSLGVLTRREGLALLSAAALPGIAVAQGEPKVGRHFRKLRQRLASSGSKIEVVEFFWYGCPACNAFEPTLQAWVKQLPATVEFRHVHIGGRAQQRPHQRLFFTLQAMGVEHQFRSAIFNAMHQQRNPLDTPEAMIKLLQPLGLDGAKFQSMWAALDPKAFSGAKIVQADKLTEAYELDGVPMLGIGGLYTTSPSQAAGGEPMSALEGGRRAVAVTEFLVRNFGKV